jgi:hypothetical protein
MARWRLLFLVVMLLGVLAWAWATDHPTPANPEGLVPPVLGFLFLAGAVAVVWSEIERQSG